MLTQFLTKRILKKVISHFQLNFQDQSAYNKNSVFARIIQVNQLYFISDCDWLSTNKMNFNYKDLNFQKNVKNYENVISNFTTIVEIHSSIKTSILKYYAERKLLLRKFLLQIPESQATKISRQLLKFHIKIKGNHLPLEMQSWNGKLLCPIERKYQSKGYQVQKLYNPIKILYFESKSMGKHTNGIQSAEDQDYKPGCEGKRPYQFVSEMKKQRLIELAVQNAVKVNRASRKVRVNNSNAKVIVRKEKEKRLSVQNECNSSEKNGFVKVELIPNEKSDQKKMEIIPQIADISQYFLNYYLVSPIQFFPLTFQ